MARFVVAFRVDASEIIGSGHVMRCLTLADAFAKRGAECHFIMRKHSGSLSSMVSHRGHMVRMLSGNAPSSSPEEQYDLSHAEWLGTSWSVDASDSIAALDGLFPDWLVVDHYSLDVRWERLLSNHTKKLMVIDDLADRRHECDLLLDQNLGRAAVDYDDLVAFKTNRLIGPRFALLREEFANARDQSLARRADGRLESIFISLGGVDKDNLTLGVLEVLEKLDELRDCRILVVLGASSPHKNMVADFVAKSKLNAELHFSSNRIGELMGLSDLAIGGAGGTAWERCCLGVPTLMLVLANNQKVGAQALHDAGAAICLGEPPNFQDRLEVALRQVSDPSRLRAMAKCAAAECDGLGVVRVLEAMREDSL